MLGQMCVKALASVSTVFMQVLHNVMQVLLFSCKSYTMSCKYY